MVLKANTRQLINLKLERSGNKGKIVILCCLYKTWIKISFLNLFSHSLGNELILDFHNFFKKIWNLCLEYVLEICVINLYGESVFGKCVVNLCWNSVLGISVGNLSC